MCALGQICFKELRVLLYKAQLGVSRMLTIERLPNKTLKIEEEISGLFIFTTVTCPYTFSKIVVGLWKSSPLYVHKDP